MRHLLGLALALACVGAPPAPAQPAQQQGETFVILDMSASMWGRIGDQTKLEIAREAVRGMFTRFPPGSRVGLMAYGHRRAGQCSDIQMIFEPGPVDAAAAGQALDRLTARGRTPLTESVRQAAAALRVRERGGTIILVTDGIETCDGDPCALAAELESANASFTAHVVGFDLRTPSERARVACIAERTGGLFVPAGNAEELAGALARTTAARPPASAPVATPRGIGLRATQGPGGATLADAIFTVLREGEETPVHEGAATRLPLAPGRYVVTGSTADRIGTVTAEVTAAAPAEIVVPLADALPRATVTPARASVDATTTVEVTWTGPRAPGSWIGVVPAGAPPGEYVSGGFVYVEDAANPLSLTAPGVPGAYEIRFVEGIDGTPLATRPLTVTAAAATLQGPESGMAGSPVTIRYAPAQAPQGSFVAIVPPGAGADDYIQNAWAYADGGEAAIHLPPTAGSYELRYVLVAPGGAQVLLRRPITATPPAATLEAPASAAAGSPVTVAFTGSRGDGDYIAIAGADAAGDRYITYFTIAGESAQGEVTMPEEKGTYELRYVMGAAVASGAVIARRRISVH